LQLDTAFKHYMTAVYGMLFVGSDHRLSINRPTKRGKRELTI
jgi:hypothetical protein